MRQIIEKVQAHAQQELQHIHQQTVDKIAGSDQYNVYLNIIVIEDFAEKAIQITDIHVEQCVKSKQAAVEQINHQAAEKSDHQSLFFSAHQPKGGRQNQKKVRRYGRDLKILKYSCL